MELFVIALLIILGTVLLVAEIALIPGLGFTGIAGVGAMIASAVYAFMQLGEIAGWITIAIVVSLAVLAWVVYNGIVGEKGVKGVFSLSSLLVGIFVTIQLNKAENM